MPLKHPMLITSTSAEIVSLSDGDIPKAEIIADPFQITRKKPCIVGYISNGLCEDIPKHASEFTSELIATSWDQAPGQRPSFANICAGLEADIDLVFPAVDKNKFREYMEWVRNM